MNGHDADGIAAYEPQDDEERMAAIMAAHDEATEEWRIETWHPSPLCPICGWELIPVEDGRMTCPDCGHEEGGPNDKDAPDPATALDELRRVRFTITPEFDDTGRLVGHTSAAADWDGGDQWSL